MPTYNFKEIGTNDYYEIFMSLSELDEFKEENPEMTIVHLTPPGIVRGVGSIDGKTSDGWRETLSKVAEAHPDSPLGERYGKNSIKKLQTRKVVKEHMKIQAEQKTNSAFLK